MAISMLKIRRPLGRLIFNMGIAIPGKTVFFIETAPSLAMEILVKVITTRHLKITHLNSEPNSPGDKELKQFYKMS